MKFKKFTHFFLLFTILLSWWAVRPFLKPGFFPIHDDTQTVRVYEMAQALKDGQFPVRWVRDLGYGFGYPIFNFYGPLAYYIGALFNLIGFNALVATKIMMVFGIVFAGVSMFFLVKEVCGPEGSGWGGLIAGLFYIYAPYHAVDIYVRGAVGEYWAMVFLPLVFLGLYRIFNNNQGGIIIGGLGFAGLILSHNLTVLMTLPFIFFTGLISLIFSKNKKVYLIRYVLMVILAFGLSAFYWLPALAEMNLTKVFGQVGGGADFRDHFIFLDQLWSSPWGFAGSASGRLDGMSFMLGKFHLLMVLVVLVFYFTSYTRLAVFFLLLALFFTTGYSRFIWETIPQLAFVQYPWRFLSLATFFASFAIGFLGRWEKKSLVLIPVLLFLNIKYFQPQFLLPVKAHDYITQENIKWQTSKTSDEYLPRDFPIPKNEKEVAWEKVKVISGQASIDNLLSKSNSLSFTINNQTPGQVIINTAYFPGWKIWVDEKLTYPDFSSGVIQLSFSSGDHRVMLKFTNTQVRNLANLISFISVLGIIGLFVRRRFK